MCGVMQVRLIDILYRGEMELRDGEDRTILRILRKIGEGVRNMIKLYVELKGVHTAVRELRQTNMIGFFGRRGRGVERPRDGNAGINKMGIGKGSKKKKKNKRGVVLRKGGYEIVANEGGTVRWEFTRG